MKTKKSIITFKEKKNSLNWDVRAEQVGFLEGRDARAMKSSALQNRHFEIIGGKKFLVVS